jgi:LPXTG-motif cell wall-anchored protein
VSFSCAASSRSLPILVLVLPALGAAAVSADEKIGSNDVSVHATKTVVNTVEASPISVGPPTRPSECPTDQTDAIPVQPQEAPEQEHQVKNPPTLPASQAPKGIATFQDEATTTSGDEQAGLGKSSTAFPDLIKVEAANPTTQPDEQQQATPSATDNGNCPPTQGHGNDDDTSDSGPAGSNTGNGSGDGNGHTTPSYTCGGKEYVLEQPGWYYCLDFRKIWLNADDLVTSPPSGASVSLDISLNDQFLGSFECTETGCEPLVVFLANFDPDTAVFHIEENGLPQGWQLHPDYQDGATFLELRDPPGQGPGPACLNTRWRNYSDLYVTECLLVIANQQVASTGGTGEDNSGGGGQGGSGQDGSGGGTGSSGGTGSQGGSGGSTGGASTAPGTSSVPASEAASPRSDAQPAGSSEALALQQPATDVSPASSAGSTMPPLPQVLPRTGQPQALTSLAGIGLVLLGCGVILLRRPARAR